MKASSSSSNANAKGGFGKLPVVPKPKAPAPKTFAAPQSLEFKDGWRDMGDLDEMFVAKSVKVGPP